MRQRLYPIMQHHQRGEKSGFGAGYRFAIVTEARVQNDTSV